MVEDIAHLFPLPWRITRTDAGHFKICDAHGRSLAYVYARNEPALRNEYLNTEEALAMARSIARMSVVREG